MITYAEYKEIVDGVLASAIDNDAYSPVNGLNDAMRYSLLAGGKRLRPVLLLEFCRVCGGDYKNALPAAAAIEMLHTYSLIHDDLPCMDNDDLRRGRPTNHKVYGECTAVLAGDALQAEAFKKVLECSFPAENVLKCAYVFAESVGRAGMCGGQFLDMSCENKILSTDELDNINLRKTGALIRAACLMGASLAGASEEQLAAAAEYGNALGKAFQIRDDVLDVTSTPEELGKPVGSDEAEGKNTYMHMFGQKQCIERIHDLTETAKEAVSGVFNDTLFLCNLAESLSARNN